MKRFFGFFLFASVAYAGDLPNPKLTPGVVNPAVTDVCSVKWGKDVRHVTLGMKQQVFASYGILWAQHSLYEVDHLISRELGGADDIRNLWPEHWASPWGAHEKDRLENKLHSLVCAGALPLPQAQKLIGGNWIAAYKKYIIP